MHSPFVYELVTKCFYDKKSYPSYQILKDYRKSLLNNEKKIKITDFGAGSQVFSSDERKVSDIAKNVGITTKQARLLNRLVRYFKVKNALELGTSVGLGTTAIAAGNKVQVTTIEGCPATAAVAKKQFEKFNLQNINLKVAEFDEVLDEISNSKSQTPNLKFQNSLKIEKGEENKGSKTTNDKQAPQPTTDNSQLITQDLISKSQTPKTKPPKPTTDNSQPKTHNSTSNEKREENKEQQTTNNKPNPQPKTHNPKPKTESPQLIFIDGNHQKEATLKYFERLLTIAHNDSVFIFDDIHWSIGMEEAWEEIKNHPAVTVTIDTYFWGFVFFRREQEKEHFIIRL